MKNLFDYLPETIEDKGIIFKPCLDLFLYTKNSAINYCKENKLKYRLIKVLSKNLRGRTDLHGKNYKPTEWIYIENK